MMEGVQVLAPPPALPVLAPQAPAVVVQQGEATPMETEAVVEEKPVPPVAPIPQQAIAPGPEVVSEVPTDPASYAFGGGFKPAAPEIKYQLAPPRSLDFLKLEPTTLLKYMEHHGLTAKPESTPAELAALVGRHFEKEAVDEDQVLQTFLMSGVQAANSLSKFDKKRKRPAGVGPSFASPAFNNLGSGYSSRKESRLAFSQIARVDEEVAVRPPTQVSEDPAVGWILARVMKYIPDRDYYHVRDEDDHTNVLTLASTNVIRLNDEVLDINKGDTVMAVFPGTTTFYRAQVAKLPKRLTVGPQEAVVRFEDDEDETGRTPHRRVPARFVLRMSQVVRFDTVHETYSDGAGDGQGAADRNARKGLKEYKAMISHALQKLPNNKGTLKEIFRIIEEDFKDELCWRLEGEGKKNPVWKNQVRKLLIDPRSGFMFINNGDKAYWATST